MTEHREKVEAWILRGEELDLKLDAMETRIAALETYLMTLTEALGDDPDGGEANEQRRWRDAHVAARARRQRERRP